MFYILWLDLGEIRGHCQTGSTQEGPGQMLGLPDGRVPPADV